MKAPKVRLYIRVYRHDGTDAYVDPVWNRNRTLRAGYALIEGKPEFHPEGKYYLRFMRDGKRVWLAVGPDVDAAVAAVQNLDFELQAVCLGRSATDSVSYLAPAPIQLRTPAEAPVTQSTASVSLDSAIDTYVSQLGLFRSPKTVRAAKRILERFANPFLRGRVERSVRKTSWPIWDLARETASVCVRSRTHVTRISALWRRHKIVDLLSRDDKPQHDERDVEADDADQLGALFAAANDDERMLFEFF